MFTGLIENVGIIEQVRPSGNYLEITISPKPTFDGLVRGESIAISGPCLTVSRSDDKTFTVEASQETLGLTTLRRLRRGDRVNLERALQADSRLGGHFVAGHVDCVSRVMRVKDIGKSRQIEIELPQEFADLVVDKGSVAIDGVSLTVVGLDRGSYAVNLIPETQKQTTLPELRPGDAVNVEFDIIGKYILRFLELGRSSSKITLAAMRDMGY